MTCPTYGNWDDDLDPWSGKRYIDREEPGRERITSEAVLADPEGFLSDRPNHKDIVCARPCGHETILWFSNRKLYGRRGKYCRTYHGLALGMTVRGRKRVRPCTCVAPTNWMAEVRKASMSACPRCFQSPHPINPAGIPLETPLNVNTGDALEEYGLLDDSPVGPIRTFDELVDSIELGAEPRRQIGLFLALRGWFRHRQLERIYGRYGHLDAPDISKVPEVAAEIAALDHSLDRLGARLERLARSMGGQVAPQRPAADP